MRATNPAWLKMAVQSQPFVVGAQAMPTGLRYGVLWAIASMPILITMAILFNLYRLFEFFRLQSVFSVGTILALRRIGIGLVVLCPALIVTRTLTVLVSTWGDAPGTRTLQISTSSQDFLVLAFGMVMLIMGVAMNEALRMDEEIRQIV